ncbi:hypothetical protein [Natronococcus wangiae]|uniref:hypothetical protein n=1 Tax=Natronococcus wangiae TaxID=3068275 RepID=UPI00273F1FEC|nr:hypothetical protein [Natronococcus sp. AD5]
MTEAATRRKDRWTLALTLVVAASFAVVYAVDEPALWLGWAVLAAAVSGSAMVLLNRETPQEP